MTNRAVFKYFRLKVSRFMSVVTASDWLIVIIIALIIVFLSIKAAILANNLALSHQEPHYLTAFLLLAFGAGYLLTVFKKWRLTGSNHVGQDRHLIIGQAVFVAVFLALPAAIFYGFARGLAPLGFNLTAAFSAWLLVTAWGVLGATLAWLRSWWGILAGLVLLYSVSVSGVIVLNQIEQALSGQSSNGLELLLISIGITGTVLTLSEILKPFSAINSGRYLALFVRRRNFPSYTGFGAIFISGVIRLMRDKLFLVIVAISAVTAVFATSFAKNYNGPAIYVIGLPILVINLGVLELAADYANSFKKAWRHLPVLASAIDFACLLGGVVSVSALVLLTSVLMGLDASITAYLLSLTIAAYTLTSLVSPSLKQPEQHGQFGWAWSLIYHLIVFAIVFVIDSNFNTYWLLGIGGLTLAATISSLGYRDNNRWATI